MRDVNLESWKPEPQHATFAHLASSPNGDAVGLVVVKMGTGRLPCRGMKGINGLSLETYLTSNPDAPAGLVAHAREFDGEVVVGSDYQPLRGAQVVYWRAESGDAETHGVVASALTDASGHHSLWLEPGVYGYQVSLGGFPLGGVRDLTVRAGRRIVWEEPLPPAEDGAVLVGVDGLPLTEVKEREIAGVWEDLVCDWHSEDGLPFDWADVEETCVRVCEKAASVPGGGLQSLTLCAAGPFAIARPDILNALQSRGVPAMDCNWRDVQFAVAYRQLTTIMRLGPLFTAHERANHQTQRGVIFVNAKKIEAAPGHQKYLADARAAAVYQAAQMAAFMAPGDYPEGDKVPAFLRGEFGGGLGAGYGSGSMLAGAPPTANGTVADLLLGAGAGGGEGGMMGLFNRPQ